MQTQENGQTCDKVLFIIDATSSMGNFLQSVTSTLNQLVPIFNLAHEKTELGILWYRDYCDNGCTGFSGFTHDINKIETFANSIKPLGGGDIPEALKTA